MLRKIFIIVAIFAVSGCSSFGRGVAEAFLDKDKSVDTRQCEIKGNKISGIDNYFSKGNTVKVLMIHGVGTHEPGYATRIRENLAKSLNLSVRSRAQKDITLLNPNNPKQEIGNLRVIQMRNEERTHTLIFYELTWSGITTPQKQILRYDVSGEYSHKRAAFNNTFKRFIDDTAPDPMIYLTDKDDLILNATKQSACWMLGKSWEQLDPKQKQICRVSSYKQIENLSHENIIFITHSLGSRIFMDAILGIADDIDASNVKSSKEAQLIINELKNKEFTAFMLANQLPMLQIGRKAPVINNKISEYCTKKGQHYQDRIFKKLNVVAFSDPNDLLSYEVPQSFADDYMDSRICPSVTNINLNIAEEISAFGIGLVNPIAAHTEYDNDTRVIRVISHGTKDIKNDHILNKRCHFIELED